jgi:hypothetical protein
MGTLLTNKELLIALGKGIVPEEKVYFELYQDIRTSFIKEGPAMIRKLKNNKASVEDWMYVGFFSSISVEVPYYCFMSYLGTASHTFSTEL